MDSVLATSAAGTIATQVRSSIKLKLIFAEPESILSPRQVQDCLEQCWILLPASCRTIGDVSAFITGSFGLHATCPDGISLAMEGFTLPLSQSAGLLQDFDLVYVRRLKIRGEGQRAGSLLSNHRHDSDEAFQDEADATLPCLGHAGNAPQVNSPSTLQARGFRDDLFERHTEYEGTQGKLKPTDHRLQSVQEGVKFLNGASGKERAGPHADKSAVDSADNQATREKVPCVAMIDKSRNKKLRKTEATSEEHVVSELLELKSAAGPELIEAPPTSATDTRKKKRKTPISGFGAAAEFKEESEAGRGAKTVVDKKLRKGHDVDYILRPNETRPGQAGVKLEESSDERKRKLVDAKGSRQGEENKKAKLLDSQAEASRPSRSSRRKKAKRRWMREEAEAEKQAGELPHGEGSRSADGMEASEDKEQELPREQQQNSFNNVPSTLARNEETTRVCMPVVDRPGHIRFEASDDEDDVERGTTSTLSLGIATLSKRKGQVWGLDKDVYKHARKSSNFRSNLRVVGGGPQPGARCTVPSIGKTATSATSIDFETLPTFDGNPMVGDILAYRLVELSASWIPVVSVYRVGKVARYDPTSSTIVLNPVDDCPLRDTFEDRPKQDEDTALDSDEFAFPAPFSSDGSLETLFTELIQVRLVQKAGTENKTNVPTAVQTTATVSKSNGVNVDRTVGPDCARENLTILKLEARPAQHRSVRALRAAALGPALALLRARQEL